VKQCAKCGACDRNAGGRCRPCAAAWARTRWADPEQRARTQALRNRPEMKERAKAKRDAPDAKEKAKERGRSEEVKELRRVARQSARQRATRKASHLRLKYGLSAAAYASMLATQRGRCAACGDEMPTSGRRGVCVDHDHDTGEVRGLLCAHCNLAEGYLRGSPLRAERLAAYLRKHAPKLRLAHG
jgi:hypothetical protein